ncbi:MAG: CHAT domain-containing protein [candidate division WOR-3 bacterium]
MDEFTRWVKELAEKYPEPGEFMLALDQSTCVQHSDVDTLERVARALSRQARPKLAIAVWKREAELLAGEHSMHQRVKVLLSICNELLSIGDLKAAMDCGNRVLRLAHEVGIKDAEAKCHGVLGEVARRSGRSNEAFRHYDTAQRIFEALGDRSGQAKCMECMGCTKAQLGDYRAGARLLTEALNHFRSLGDAAGESRSLVNLGICYRRLGKLDKARECLEQSLTLKKEIGDLRGEGVCLGVLANIYGDLGDRDKVMEYLHAAVEVFVRTDDQYGQSANYANLGIEYRRARNTALALEYLTRALKIKEWMGDNSGMGKCHTNLGDLYAEVGRLDEARRHYDIALSFIEATGDQCDFGQVHEGLARVCAMSGDIEGAGEHYVTALAVYKTISASCYAKNCLASMARMYLDAEEYEKALGSCHEAVSSIEAMRSDGIPADYRDRFWRDNVPLFDSTMLCHLALRDIAGALAYSERGKGRTIHDLMLMRGIEPERFKPEPLSYDEIAALAARLDRTMVLFRVTDHGTFAFVLPPTGRLELVELPAFTARRLSDLVVQMEDNKPRRGWFGTYSEYKRAQEEASRLIADGKIEEASALLRSSQERWFSTMEQTLAALSEELISRVFDKLAPGTRIVLVPNRALNILPLHACWRTEDGRKRYLLEDYEISYAPNCNILDLCQKREAESDSRSASRSLFAVANPAPPYELVFSEWEVDELARHFDQKEVLVKAEAKQALLERGRNAGVIHLSTHGIHDIGLSFNSRLKLGRDEELTLEEVFENLRLEKNWLVTLSACESGLLDYRDIADEFIGLQAGFLYAGAPTVIASLWSIADYTTALVMMKLYENICPHRMTKAAALRSAQLWLKELTAGEALKILKAKEEVLEYSERMAREDISPVRRAVSLEDPGSRPFAHPYFWAGYQLFGV